MSNDGKKLVESLEKTLDGEAPRFQEAMQNAIEEKIKDLEKRAANPNCLPPKEYSFKQRDQKVPKQKKAKLAHDLRKDGFLEILAMTAKIAEEEEEREKATNSEEVKTD